MTMATATKTYDVFISHSAADKETARLVAQSLDSVGLTTCHLGAVENSDSLSGAIWEALSESHAVIALVSSESRNSANVMLEIGAASAWNKPVLVIVMDPESALPSGILQKYPAYPLSRLDDVILAIKSGFKPLTESEREVLMDAYRKVAVPADQLNQSSKSLGEISNEFRQRTRKAYSSERHIDSHADMGLGDPSYVYIMCELLHSDLPLRRNPKRDSAYGLSEGNYVSFALACRWISNFKYVQHPQTRRSNHGGLPDIADSFFANNDPGSDTIQLKAYLPNIEVGINRITEYEPIALEPMVPIKYYDRDHFRSTDNFSFFFVAISPNYTPEATDLIIPTVQKFIRPI